MQGKGGRIRQGTLVLACTVPKSVQTSHEGKVTRLWNQHMKTARTIPNNKMGIIHDNETGTSKLTDTAI
jgi:hypothetical protein